MRALGASKGLAFANVEKSVARARIWLISIVMFKKGY